MLRQDQTQIPISKELREKLKELGKKGQTYEEIILSLIENKEKNQSRSDRPTPSRDTHTHKKGIDDILDWIKENNPTGITKSEIERAIKEVKGMDTRTIRKYEPEVIHNLLSLGYQMHPINSNLFIRYDLPKNNGRMP